MFTLVEEAVYLTAPVFTSQDMKDAVEMHQYYCLPRTIGHSQLTVRHDSLVGRTLYIQAIGSSVLSKVHQGTVILSSLAAPNFQIEDWDGETFYLGHTGFSFRHFFHPEEAKLEKHESEQVALAS